MKVEYLRDVQKNFLDMIFLEYLVPLLIDWVFLDLFKNCKKILTTIVYFSCYPPHFYVFKKVAPEKAFP